jgi:hypothetical protein
MNRVLHIMAIVQLRHDTAGRAYYRRRLSDVVYRQMTRDIERSRTGPAGRSGATLQSSAADPNPEANTTEQSLSGPADHHPGTPNSGAA